MLVLRFALSRVHAPSVPLIFGNLSLVLRTKKTQSESKPIITCDHRYPSPCDYWHYPPDPKPCFDISKMLIERGNACHEKLIRAFLYTHYWPREPSCTGLWMSLCSPYLAILSERYSTSGDRYLAFERQDRTHERKLVGLICAYKVFPWYMDELEEWANNTVCRPDRNRMYFTAHCFRSPNLFAKYKVPYIYDMEVLATASEVCRQGVAQALVERVLADATETRHPLVQLVAKNSYASKICTRAGMTRAWSMDYSDFIDDAGQSVFFPRRPHHTVSVYIKKFNPNEVSVYTCKPPGKR